MSNGTTITSLAMLKVNMNVKRQDYMGYLRPFVLDVIGEHRSVPITEQVVAKFLQEDYGLRIPNSAIQIVLHRIAKDRIIERVYGEYKLVGPLPPSNIQSRRSEAKRMITEIVKGFVSFAEHKLNQQFSDEDAYDALTAFLQDFAIDCLRTYIFSTALPEVKKKKSHRSQYCVSLYVKEIHEQDSKAFNSFMTVVKGHMLANALLCPDLDSVTKSFKNNTFYFDTPIIIRLLKLQGDADFAAASVLLDLVKKLDAKVAIFSHNKEEINRVLEWNEYAIKKLESRSKIIDHCRAAGKDYSDIEFERNRLEDSLVHLGIEVENTPKITEDKYKFVISVKDLEILIHSKVQYWEDDGPAIKCDINSIISIYILRQGKQPPRLEDAGAVFVTTNSALASAAFSFGKEYESTKEVSSVISDFSLSNLAWLKQPLGAPDLPMREVLAYCYAALSPNESLWQKYVKEADKLFADKRITENDWVMLRCSRQVQDELMNLTCGEEDALHSDTVEEIVEAVKYTLTEEKNVEIQRERQEKEKAKQEKRSVEEDRMRLEKHLYWLSVSLSKVLALVLAGLLSVGVVLASFIPTKIYSFFQNDYLNVYWILGVPFLILLFMGFTLMLLNLFFGLNVSSIYSSFRDFLQMKIYGFLMGSNRQKTLESQKNEE